MTIFFAPLLIFENINICFYLLVLAISSIRSKEYSKSPQNCMISNSTLEYISKKTESRVSNRYLHSQVHSSITHNSQKVDTP